ncbi:chromosomal replication initiator protein DnaA [Leuconostoc falkenbergense]|uniref:Chromosomal replication initiator protein DnaA n=1 Tax=Leuconostoc falkenbergense TaxID=2766470 RepID=A0ABT7S1E8_9LACO|nr:MULTISPECIES: chromosomal replication initiator protein DnaA [Leuconostoc]RDG17685.1 chromosomal replication initiator protein DnaA [Leuconostoc pseudomesenteroides]MCT4389096.1 chromosomal replication initiator protein DnaA [Leuconostoc falkenbergense]MCT4410408.1 chromosomal replication initiator protein DnaA [Leuconostoc falkenbergense]MDM7647402.1 chromosomal replication initiator protein DnaA [Leuconostoc falkenbergense]MDY5163341.1 chromosomal replication initiator protein DnaA [Leuco
MTKPITKEELWSKVQAEFFTKLGRVTFSTYIEPLKPITLEDTSLTLSVPSDMAQDIIDQWDREYSMDFVQFAMTIADGFIKPDLQIAQPKTTAAAPTLDNLPFTRESDLNPDFTFEKFVIGSGNENAYAVARAVADEPGQVYNPYLIYGGVGLGKTHLMQAIGNAYATSTPSAHIKYATAEDFLNDFTESLRAGDGATAAFKQEYRSVDLLLVDDIQFWSGKEKVQEEFFNTFNVLTKNGKQIVMTSDKLPTEIVDLQTRLTSRFEAGIMMDIQKPDLPTRVAILQNLSESDGLTIPNDVLELIAEKIDSNVRSLEGAFHKFEASLRYMNKPATKETAQQILGDLNINQGFKITVERIQQVVADYYMQTIDDLKSSSRKKDLVTARHVAMYLTRTLTNESLPDIGRAFGGRDHSSVLHATTKITEKSESDPRTKEMLDALTDEIKNGK